MTVLAGCVVLDHELNVTGDGNFSTLRTTNETSVQLVELNVEVCGYWRQQVNVSASGSNLERFGAF